MKRRNKWAREGEEGAERKKEQKNNKRMNNQPSFLNLNAHLLTIYQQGD